MGLKGNKMQNPPSPTSFLTLKDSLLLVDVYVLISSLIGFDMTPSIFGLTINVEAVRYNDDMFW